MVDSIINTKDLSEAEAVILSVPYGEAASFGKGAENGPKEIIACLDSHLELFDRFTRNEPTYLFPIGHKQIENLEGLTSEKMIAKVVEEYPQQYTVMLGGDHSISIAAWDVLASRHVPSDVTILQVDAHLDLRDDDSEYNDDNPSKLAHSCVMRRAHDHGFPLVQVGIRTYAQEEYDFVLKNRDTITVFEWGRTAQPSVQEVITAIKTEKVYLTVDVDGFDPSVMPATGTPVPGGMSWSYGVQLLQELHQKKDVVGVDIVETAPQEYSGLTQYAAAQLCYNMLSYRLLKQKDGSIRFFDDSLTTVT